MILEDRPSDSVFQLTRKRKSILLGRPGADEIHAIFVAHVMFVSGSE
jgi:hypothetical protein